MNHPFMHLLWKSYRSQREIWLTITGLMLLLQLVGIALSAPRSVDSPSTIVLVVSMLMAPIFLCVSMLLMFVMEEEQQTATLLRMLKIRWWHQLGAGVICSMGLTMVLGLISFIVAVAVNILFSRQFDQKFIHEMALTWCYIILPVYILGMAVSLVFRRVLAVVGTIAFFGVVIASTHESFSSTAAWPRLIVSYLWVGPLIAIPFLVRKWQVGRPMLMTSFLTDAVGRLKSGKAEYAWNLSFTIPDWRRWLLGNAIHSDGQKNRETRVLYWQEICEAIPFAILSSCAGLACIAYHVSVDYPFPAVVLWLMLLTMECGLRSYRRDQQQQNGLFLAHRGISPIKVWLIKNSVWFTVLMLVAFLAWWLESRAYLLTGYRVFQGSLANLSEILFRVADPLQFAGEPINGFVYGFVNGSATTPGRVFVAMLCLGYFVAQLCSVWLRPPFVAGFVALICVIFLPGWVDFSQSRDVPLSYSTWPVTVFCIAIILITRREWSDRRPQPGLWVRRIVACVLLPISLIVGHLYYRTTQISAGRQRLIAMANIKGIALSSVKPVPAGKPNPKTDALWLQLMNLDDLGDVRDSTPARAVQILEDILESDNWNKALLPIELRTSWQASICSVVERHTIQQAYALVEAEQIAKAFQLFRNGIQLTEYLSYQTTSGEELNRCASTLRILHQHLQLCASSDFVSSGELGLAVEQFSESGASLEAWADRATCSLHENRLWAFQQLASDGSELQQQFTSKAPPKYSRQVLEVNDYLSRSRFEKARHLDLLRTYSALLPERWELSPSLVIVGHTLERWRKSTIEFGTENSYADAVSAAADSRRATQWILQAQIYRRNFGRFPTESEFRRWLIEQRQGTLAQEMSRSRGGSRFSFHLEGTGRQSVEAFQMEMRIDPEQPVIEHVSSVLATSFHHSQFPADQVQEVPPLTSGFDLNPDRIIYLEGVVWTDPVPPIFGKRADLLSNPELENE